jgi:hypothetical protein
MEDVLSVYTRPYDERFAQVCMDESGKQLVTERLQALCMRPGRPERSDYSYEPGQMYNLFLACEPPSGNTRGQSDRAEKAERLVLVMDNLATHTPAALYHTFAPGLGATAGGEARDPSQPRPPPSIGVLPPLMRVLSSNGSILL